MNVKSMLKKVLVSDALDHHVETNLKKSVGSFGYDPWGFNMDSAKIGLAVLKLIHDKYFRVEAKGLENIPKEGRILLIPNHSGQLPMDGILLGISLALSPYGPRAARAMIERFFPTVPVLGNILNAFGAVIGDPLNCAKMLEREEAIIVFPEGIRGSGKLYKDRYQLKRFGNGFMHLAMTYKTPIIPVGVVGCEETIPAIAHIQPLAKMLGIPYVPIAPPFIIPAKVYFHIGQPMNFTGNIDNEDSVTKNVEKVKTAIRDLIQQGLKQRKGIF